jgi:hypothetical protein
MKGFLALLLVLQGTAAPARAPDNATARAPSRVPTVTAKVTPEAPAIGDPITIELRVRAPAGAEVRFPVLPDTGTRIEPLDPRAIRDRSTADGVDRTATYRLIAWDTGSVDVAFSDVTVRRNGVEQRYPVQLRRLRIRSLLPADTTLRVPKPAADALDAPSVRWRLWLGLAVLLALLIASYCRWRRWRRERADAPPDAIGAARAAFVHARELNLLEAGEPGRHLLAHVGVMRRYLAERWPVAGADLTAQELAHALPRGDFPILPARVVILVSRGEGVAFARARIENSEAQTLGVEAAAVTEDLETVWAARRAEQTADKKRIKRKPLS